MSVVKDSATGRYHGFVSEFENGCKLDSWTTNSYVNHVVAPAPEGPWTQAKAGRALNAWAHNPKLAYSEDDKLWLMYHIGTGSIDPSRVKNCSSASSKMNDEAANPAPFVIHTATSLDGPWTPASQHVDQAEGSRLMTLQRGVSNVDIEVPKGYLTLFQQPKYAMDLRGAYLLIGLELGRPKSIYHLSK